ncbi:unnamed protein product [Pneumocystis jirovecii]|uniref:Dipeptidyl-peptidase IV n=1 Tax=Pneumocystis jirovecii TaxID=42068 RepID=L0P7X9_PNEJI|nr:unnamed protein product [Pneumocystis jirovecii]
MSLENDTEKAQNNIAPTQDNQEKPKKSRRKYVIITAALVIFLLVILMIVIFVIRAQAKKVHKLDDSRRVTLDKWHFKEFYPSYRNIKWASGDEVSYFDRRDKTIIRVYLNGTSYMFLNETQVKKSNGGTYAEKRWRHSYFGNYWVYDVKKQELTPLIKDQSNAKVSYARWSPTGHKLAYVYENDIYVQDGAENAQRVTTDGSDDIFNGIPDWVYEEEVFSTNHVFWWSPDSKYLAFMRTNDTEVENIHIPLHMESYSYKYSAPIYPETMTLKYPRVGSKNPQVSLHIVDIHNGHKVKYLNNTDTKDDDNIITEVVWVGKTELLVKKTNRQSNFQYVYLFNATTGDGKLTRTLNATKIDGGWFEPGTQVTPIPSNRNAKRYGNGYIEIAINKGYYHIAYFRLNSYKNPKFLTNGNWEVVSIAGFDSPKSTVYFIATKKSSIEKHLYKVSLLGGDVVAVTDEEKDGYYYADFSPSGTAYLLTYTGPEVPWQKIKKVDNEDYDLIIEKNEDLTEKLGKYDLPEKRYSTIRVGDYDMNVLEIVPPNFDDSGATKYPVLFHVYGGPASQLVSKRYRVSWSSVLSSDPDLQCIVVSVDGRGTGFMGRKFLTEIQGRIGVYESLDQLEVARQWKNKKYVDKDKFAIWGWSYGGYITLKALEKGTGVFQYGISVAPGTDFRYYDTIYTERYLGLFNQNPAGYQDASITNILGFKNATRFLVMHGSADENVHLQHTMKFVSGLVYHGLTNYDMHIFPDSAHDISANNAKYTIYKRMYEWLKEAFKNIMMLFSNE